jgi:hypothetical protein
MCTLSYMHFACGCSRPIPGTLQKCAWADLKGRGYVCLDFQIGEDRTKSRESPQRCMAHS